MQVTFNTKLSGKVRVFVLFSDAYIYSTVYSIISLLFSLLANTQNTVFYATNTETPLNDGHREGQTNSRLISNSGSVGIIGTRDGFKNAVG